MLVGAHAVGALDGAAQVEHGKHGDDHHDTLKQQGDFKLLPDPAWSVHKKSETKTDEIQKFNEKC